MLDNCSWLKELELVVEEFLLILLMDLGEEVDFSPEQLITVKAIKKQRTTAKS